MKYCTCGGVLHPVFIGMLRESYRRRLGTLLLCLSDVFGALINFCLLPERRCVSLFVRLVCLSYSLTECLYVCLSFSVCFLSWCSRKDNKYIICNHTVSIEDWREGGRERERERERERVQNFIRQRLTF